ncbi:MAG TPA: TIGR04053 family radical SAM/SPASM domain-containing protein [Terriglobales bacterium]|nr:TIGR04053 family radical SAM/SPASM domain-containing protein [Terriglobales bacterium]
MPIAVAAPVALPPHAHRNYSRTPMNVYWETTRACPLACRHCRAEAVLAPHPDELTTAEASQLLLQIAEFGDPLPQLILTGGDPLSRPDLLPLLDCARGLGLRVSITPAASPALTRERLVQLQAAGVEALGLSLDGSTPARHDRLRGVPGTFDRTLDALLWGRELGFPLQVNSLVSAETADDLPAIYELLRPLGIARWSLFFLIAVGRGHQLQPLSPAQAESLMHWIFECSRQAPFIVATTEAPSYRRLTLTERRGQGVGSWRQLGDALSASGRPLPGIEARPPSDQRERPGQKVASHVPTATGSRAWGIRDGHGIVFVSHTGEIYPSGFLPLSAGNIRRQPLAEVYRTAPLFAALHDPRQFHGRCGRCEFQAVCGGSRARAYAATGDPLAADPLCAFEPGSLRA